MKKNLLITFDYELFLGSNSGEINKCLIEPTNKVIELLRRYKMTGIFFIDSTYLTQLKSREEKRAIEDYQIVKKQILTLVKEGHYCFPHIHSHWLDSKYDANQNFWRLTNLDKYSFPDLNEEEREDVFSTSIDTLSQIIKEQYPDYSPEGFRAGGWCVQPFSSFKPYFLKYGVKYDFSVLCGQAYQSKAQRFDYTDTPVAFPYQFENEVTIEDRSGQFVEFPISTISVSKTHEFLNKIALKVLWKLGDRSYGKGRSADGGDAKLKHPNLKMISIELMNRFNLSTYLKFSKANKSIHFISHPKMLSQHNIRTFDVYLKSMNRKYEIETDFKKMEQ